MALDQKVTSKLGLPLFINARNKAFVGIIMWVLAATLYVTSNHFHFSEPRLLPMFLIDRMVPFLPNTVWIYLSEYVFFVAIYLCSKDHRNLTKYFYSFMSLQTVSVIIFFLWPTTYPRDLFPLPADLNSITYHAFSALRTADTPANCAPSLHVSTVFLSTYIYLDEQRGKFPFFFIWGSLIALSTLTTKQHYIVDVISGFLMSLIFYWVFHRYIPYREMRGTQAN